MTRFEELELLRDACRNLAVLLETVLIVHKPTLAIEFHQKALDAVRTAKLLA